MDVVIQTSSAALLAIPGFLVASGKGLPSLAHSWLLAVGAAAFGLAFVCGCLEQVLSGKAYKAQRLVVQKYYTQQSTRIEDRAAIRRADWARRSALTIFAIAVSLGAFGLLQVARDTNGYSTSVTSTPAASTSTPGSAAASTAATATAATAAAASPTAGAASPTAGAASPQSKFRRRRASEIEPRSDNSAAAKKGELTP